MTDFSDKDALLAGRIIQELLEFAKGFTGDPPSGTSIADMELDVRQFQREMAFVEAVGGRVPVLELDSGPPVPVSLAVSKGEGRPWWRLIPPSFPPYPRIFEDLLESLDYSARVSVGEARGYFRDRAIDFLAQRIWFGRTRETATRFDANLPPKLGAPPRLVPGCQFVVTTNTAGLTVYWSGAYFIAPNYFGHPTTPTVSLLQAGTYVFGIAGGAYSAGVQWDRHATCTLPGKPSVHLNY